MEFQITLNHMDWSGPFDVLLGLIERKRIPLSEISILNIIDEYISFLDINYENIPKESIAEFISLASNLVFIKSQYLLPKAEKLDEGDVLLKNLEVRLLLLSQIHSVCKEYSPDGEFVFSKVFIKKDIVEEPFSLKDHHYNESFFRDLVSQIVLRKEKRIHEASETILPTIIIERTVSLPEIISFWEKSFDEEKGKELLFYGQFKKLLTQFNMPTMEKSSFVTIKKNLAAHFLSVLELSRNHDVILTQDHDFGDIIIFKE